MVSTHECRCPCADPSPREPVRARPGPAPPRRRHVRGRPEPDPDPLVLQEGGRGLGSRPDGRRHGAGIPGVPRRPQHDAWPGQGRHPLPPGRDAGRGQGARDVDDLEVRPDGPPVRRREGRRDLRSEAPLARREGAPDPALHERDHQRDRPREGHPGSRCRHRRAGDGVDLRHVLDERRPLGPRRRHGQAARGRRLGRTRRRDRARLCSTASGPRSRSRDRASTTRASRSRASGTSARTSPACSPRRACA